MKRKHYSARWSEHETFALIAARAAKETDFKMKNCQFPVIWAAIHSSCGELENRTPQECIKKWKNLVDTYKKMKDPKTGTAPTTSNSSNWIFFDKINDIMGTKHTIVPNIIESSTHSRIRTISDNDSLDYLIEFDPESVDECNEAIVDVSLPSTSHSAIESIENNITRRKRPKIQEEILQYLKDRDKKIFKSIEKNNKMMRSVCQKYFPDVELSSDSD